MKTHYPEGHYGADKKPCSSLINGTVPPYSVNTTSAETQAYNTPEATNSVSETTDTYTDNIPEATSSGYVAGETTSGKKITYLSLLVLLILFISNNRS
jgi:hypothetical protein